MERRKRDYPVRAEKAETPPMALPSPAYWKAEGAGGKAGGAKLEAGCRKTGAPKNPEDPDRDFLQKEGWAARSLGEPMSKAPCIADGGAWGVYQPPTPHPHLKHTIAWKKLKQVAGIQGCKPPDVFSLGARFPMRAFRRWENVAGDGHTNILIFNSSLYTLPP